MIIGISSVVLVIHGPFQDGPAGGIDLKFIFGIAVVDLSFIDDVAVVLISFDLDMALCGAADAGERQCSGFI